MYPGDIRRSFHFRSRSIPRKEDPNLTIWMKSLLLAQGWLLTIHEGILIGIETYFSPDMVGGDSELAEEIVSL